MQSEPGRGEILRLLSAQKLLEAKMSPVQLRYLIMREVIVSMWMQITMGSAITVKAAASMLT